MLNSPDEMEYLKKYSYYKYIDFLVSKGKLCSSQAQGYKDLHSRLESGELSPKHFSGYVEILYKEHKK